MSNERTSGQEIRAGQPAPIGASPGGAVADRPGEPGVIFLPPPKTTAPAAVPSTPPRWFVGMDRLQALMLLGLAFLLGSFAATNSDLWMQLATGRMIADGKWEYGVDPFSYATQGKEGAAAVPWYNQNWLFALVLYKLYGWIGGAGLVVVKALVVVLLILCLLRIRPTGGSRQATLWITLLAALAMSPHVLLQPATLSLCFFGMTLLLLFKGGALTDAEGDAKPGILWRIPLLFVLWANLDSWVILGPLTVLLLWIGSGLSLLLGQKNAVPGRTMGLLFVVSVLACLANPHHVHVFQLPSELAYLIVKVTKPLGIALPDFLVAGGKTLWQIQHYEPDFNPLLGSLSWRYISAIGGGRSVAGFAAALLLMVSLVSFILVSFTGGPTKFPMKRFLIWLVFTSIAVGLFRLIPLFAVVAGPFAVLNFADFSAWLRSTPSAARTPNWTLGALARLALLPVLLLTYFLAWPGWISHYPGDFTAPRRVAWTVVEDPSLRDAAKRLAELEREGKLRRVFNLTPEIANYCAWLAPSVKCSFDFRYTLYPQFADVYASTKNGLKQWAEEPERIGSLGDAEMREAFFALKKARQDAQTAQDPNSLANVRDAEIKLGHAQKDAGAKRTAAQKAWEANRLIWEQELRQMGVDHVVMSTVYKPGARLTWVQKLSRLWWDPSANWVQRYADGRTLAFFWNEANKPRSECDDWWAQSSRKAFGPNVPEDARAPMDGAALPTGDVSWWDKYVEGLPPQLPLDYHKALMASMRYEYMAMVQEWRGPAVAAAQFMFWSAPPGMGAAAPGTTLGPNAMLSLWFFPVRVYDFVLSNNRTFLAASDIGPPAEPIMMMRHIRRAIAERPNDHRNYLLLHDASQSLLENVEDYWSRRGRSRSTTLRTLLRRVQSNTALKTYLDVQPHDPETHLAIAETFREQHFLDLALEHYKQALTYLANSPIENADGKRKQLEGLIKALERDVLARRAEFDLKATSQRGLDRYEIAVRHAYSTFDQNNKEIVDPRGLGLVLLGLQELRTLRPETLTREEIVEATRAQVHMLLLMGRAAEVEETLSDRKVQEMLGTEFHQFRLWLGAAKGDYAMMEQSLIKLEATVDLQKVSEVSALMFGLNAQLSLLNELPMISQVWHHHPVNSSYALTWRDYINRSLHQAAELRLLRGILQLESGNTAKALELIAQSRKIAGPALIWQDRPIARRYETLLREEKARANEP